MKKTTLALIISAFSTTTMAQNVVVFGDSLSDIGQQSWAHKASYYHNGMANPLYNEMLAQMLGAKIQSSSNGGTNYAYSGGVAVGTNSSYTPIQPNVVVQKQIENYLAHGVKPADLHIVWSGGNDVAAILQRALSGSNPVGEVLSGSTEAAKATATHWAMLHKAGVETAIFPTVPNVVYTPSLFQQFGQSAAATFRKQAEQFVPAAQAQLVEDAFNRAFTAHLQTLNDGKQKSFADFEQSRLDVLKNTVATLYQSPLGAALASKVNQQAATQLLIQSYLQAAEQAAKATALFNDYTTKALNQIGGNVVRLDVDGLFKELLSQPEAYGLNNTVGVACKSTTTTACTTPVANADQMLFADSFHPNTIAHQVMADYIYTTLNSPKDMVLLSRLAEHNHDLALNIARNESNRNRLHHQEERTVSAFAQHQRQNDGNATFVGLKAQFTPEWQISATVSQQKQQAKLGSVTADSKTKSFNTTLRYDAPKWWVGTGVQVSSDDYKTQRSVKLGLAHHAQQAETSGATVSAAVFGGYEWQFNNNVIAAISDITYSQNKIAAFGEQNVGSTRLEFAEQKYNDLKTGIGAEYRFQGEQFQPFVSARWIKDWSNKAQKLGVHLNGSPFKVALPETDRSWLNFQAGVNYQFAKLPLDLTAYIGQDVGRNEKIGGTTATLGLRYQF
ncbi:hypothetical protein A1D29_06690 [Pasteurellaceae bacterium Orientalotternb1]|nr:hypothetical protein A1D29_06690 [Pasteurellaceae bacterium Orientalotternb1]